MVINGETKESRKVSSKVQRATPQKGKVNHREVVERKAKEGEATREARVILKEANLALLSTALLAPIASSSGNMEVANTTTPKTSIRSS